MISLAWLRYKVLSPLSRTSDREWKRFMIHNFIDRIKTRQGKAKCYASCYPPENIIIRLAFIDFVFNCVVGFSDNFTSLDSHLIGAFGQIVFVERLMRRANSSCGFVRAPADQTWMSIRMSEKKIRNQTKMKNYNKAKSHKTPSRFLLLR